MLSICGEQWAHIVVHVVHIVVHVVHIVVHIVV
jgi:hypothetical protein